MIKIIVFGNYTDCVKLSKHSYRNVSTDIPDLVAASRSETTDAKDDDTDNAEDENTICSHRWTNCLSEDNILIIRQL